MVKLENIKYLKDKTGMGFIICKNILVKNNDDLNQSLKDLKNIAIEFAKNLKKRKTKEGLVISYIHPGNQRGVLLELKCESDFVARHKNFETLGQYLAYHLTVIDSYTYISFDDLPNQLIPFINPSQIFYTYKCLDNPEKTINDYIFQYICEFKENINLTRYYKLTINKQ